MIGLPKPRFRSFFETDIVRNLEFRSDNFAKPLYLNDLMKECVMYATDMCIEFQQKSDGLLSSEWIDHITTEVCAVFKNLFPNKFGCIQVSYAKIKVAQLMQTPTTALKQVNEYYNR